MSYFLAGVPYILWDNIRRGSQISCPHIERSCTADYYADRKLGVSEIVATSAATIHLFAGNNIAPNGELTSRSPIIRLDANRVDPENRKFKHPDPLGWTFNNRAQILQALWRCARRCARHHGKAMEGQTNRIQGKRGDQTDQ